MMNQKFQTLTDEEIARYAYHLWESEGRVHGRDLDYWLQAEAHLTATREYEANLLNLALQEQSENKSRTANSSLASSPRPARKRQTRVVRQAEAVCA